MYIYFNINIVYVYIYNIHAKLERCCIYAWFDAKFDANRASFADWAPEL